MFGWDRRPEAGGRPRPIQHFYVKMIKISEFIRFASCFTFSLRFFLYRFVWCCLVLVLVSIFVLGFVFVSVFAYASALVFCLLQCRGVFFERCIMFSLDNVPLWYDTWHVPFQGFPWSG